MPLPALEIQSFGRPSVKDGVLRQPVTLKNGGDGFCTATPAAARKAAWEILAVTHPTKPLPRRAQPKDPRE